ncbi:MAG: hypothetical protein QOJ35_1413 [Solirubrobacteraceae bacterium]|nr:hypothetical protein [Solirubrobacteraceae bacterium]
MSSTLLEETEAGGFGLVDERRLTVPRAPRRRRVELLSAATITVLRGLDQLVERHRAVPVTSARGDERPLAGVGASWLGAITERPQRHIRTVDALPLADVWSGWLQDRSVETRDRDGHELWRAAACFVRPIEPPVELRHRGVLWALSATLAVLTARDGCGAFLLDAAEDILRRVPGDELRRPVARDDDWRTEDRLVWLTLFSDLQAARPELVPADQAQRAWALWRWVSEPPGGPVWGQGESQSYPRATQRLVARPPLDVAVLAHRDAAASDDDLLDHLVGARGVYRSFFDLRELTAVDAEAHPLALTLARGARDRLVGLELARGDSATYATEAVRWLRDSGGLDVLAAALRVLGKTKLRTNWSFDERSGLISHVVRVSHPTPQDTPERFARVLGDTPRPRLVELAVHAPQWAALTEQTTGLTGLEETVWWLHAHTKSERNWSIDDAARDWRVAVGPRTPLSETELFDGAADVAWFERVVAQLPADAWPEVLAATRMCGEGYTRARMFASALLGQTSEDELLSLVHAKKRDTAALCALGLLSLDDERAVRRRWEAIEQFGRESRQFGSSRRATERRAVEIAHDNLARLAGYSDPVRLGWAMRAEQLRAALAQPPLHLQDVQISLHVDDGTPTLDVRRGQRRLKSVPAAVAKDPQVKELKDAVADLRRQASGVQTALEAAMVRAELWTVAELGELLGNPIVAPRLERLILTCGPGMFGLPSTAGALHGPDGRAHPLDDTLPVRIAHPVDLWQAGLLPSWQRHIVAARIQQPFKQAFREFYEPGDSEDEPEGTRWLGYVIERSRAAALLSQRGWTLDHEDPNERIDHDRGIVAMLDTSKPLGGAPETGPATITFLGYRDLRTPRALEACQVPAILFSEIQRDVDLVVTVAGPDSIWTTVRATRAQLVEATAAALGLTSVTVTGATATIRGQLATYTVDLHTVDIRLATGQPLVVPVNSTDLARVFLPHDDEDPRTAELLATILLLADDAHITAPGITDQISASGHNPDASA